MSKDLKAQIEAEKKEREKRCADKLNTLLQEENCELITKLTWFENRPPIFEKLIIAKDL